MKAAQLASYGEHFDIAITNNAAEPTIDANQVQVAVKAAAVNPFDLTVSIGQAQSYITLQLPATIGGDFAGLITQVGKDVASFVIGDEVYGQAKFSAGKGSFAEIAAADSNVIAYKPKSIDFTHA